MDYLPSVEDQGKKVITMEHLLQQTYSKILTLQEEEKDLVVHDEEGQEQPFERRKYLEDRNEEAYSRVKELETDMLAADDALKRAELESQKWRKRDLGPTQEKRAKVRKKVQEQTENIWKQTKAVRKLSEIKHTQYLGQVELLKKQIADQQQKLANRQHMIENQKQFLDDLVPQLALLVQDQPNADPKPEDQSAMQ